MPRATRWIGCTIALCLASWPRPAAATDVLLVSIDGLKPEYYRRPDDLGLAIPNLRKLVREGVSADAAEGVMPTATFPTHTSIITGVHPVRHGIENNTVFDPTDVGGGGWYWYYADIRVPTLFTAARAEGLTTAAVTWPVTAGAPIDLLVPDMYPNANLREAKNLAALSRGVELTDLVDDVRALVHMDDAVRTRVALRFLEHRPDFMALHYLELDLAQHEHGPFSPEAFAALERVDGLLGEVLRAMSDLNRDADTAVVVVSDHGFGTIHSVVNLIPLFRLFGLLETSDRGRVTRWHAYPWVCGGTAAVIVHPDAPPQALAALDDALDVLRRDPRLGVRTIWKGETLARTGGFGTAHVVLEAAPGYAFTERRSATLLVEPTLIPGTHGYHPKRPFMQGGFVAAGPGIEKGKRLGRVRLIDVAPTIAALLGVRLPDVDGRVMTGVLDASRRTGVGG